MRFRLLSSIGLASYGLVVVVAAACGGDEFTPEAAGGAAGSSANAGSNAGTNAGAAAGTKSGGGASGGMSSAGSSGAAGSVDAPECTVGADCDKGDRCLGASFCSGNKCFYQDIPVIDDGDPCTIDECEPTTGVVTHSEVNPADGDPCTTDTCTKADGVKNVAIPNCMGCTKDADCDDGDPCTANTCKDTKCTSVKHPVNFVCAPGTFCVAEKRCTDKGTCVGGAPVKVDDGDKCTVDACDAEKQVITHAPVVLENNDPCSQTTCDPKGGITKISLVDDKNACTDDTCDQNLGPVHTPKPTSDEKPCTKDLCDEQTGQVTHPEIVGCVGCTDATSCNDDNPCTTDSCIVDTGTCAHEPVTGVSCDDGDVCNGSELCDAGACIPGAALPVDDANPCTIDSCDPKVPGGIVNVQKNVDDNDACTVDTCDSQTGSDVHTPKDGGACCATDAFCAQKYPVDREGKCFPPSTCNQQTHTCSSGAGEAKDDGNDCTTDSCSPDGLVAHSVLLCAPGGAKGDVCNPKETCSAGKCVPMGQATTLDNPSECDSHTCLPDGKWETLICCAGSQSSLCKECSSGTVPIVCPPKS